MVVTFSGSAMIKKAKLSFKIIILATIVFYILPKLLSLLWYIHYPEQKIREDHLLETPLRVMTVVLHVSLGIFQMPNTSLQKKDTFC